MRAFINILLEAVEAIRVISPTQLTGSDKIAFPVLYRGVEGTANRDQALRMMKGGDLGNGCYFSPLKSIASTYGGTATSNLADGTRVVHQYRVRDLYPEEVVFLFGGAKINEPVRLVSGNGIELWSGDWKVSAFEPALEGAKVVVGTPLSVGVNQVCIRDFSVLESNRDVIGSSLDIMVESLSKALPIEWRDHSNDDVRLIHGLFQIDDGLFKVQFKKPYYDNVWNLSFDRNLHHSLTNTGNAFVVIATVVQAVREFIKSVSPRHISFSANMLEPSRAKLYSKIMDRLSKEFPEFESKTKVTNGPSGQYKHFNSSQPPQKFVPPAPVPKPKEEYREITDDEFHELMKRLDR